MMARDGSRRRVGSNPLKRGGKKSSCGKGQVVKRRVVLAGV